MELRSIIIDIEIEFSHNFYYDLIFVLENCSE